MRKTDNSDCSENVIFDIKTGMSKTLRLKYRILLLFSTLIKFQIEFISDFVVQKQEVTYAKYRTSYTKSA